VRRRGQLAQELVRVDMSDRQRAGLPKMFRLRSSSSIPRVPGRWAGGWIKIGGQSHPLFARDNTLLQSDEHDKSVRSIESEKDGALTIQ
jgi:hypothetical protein